MYGLNLEWLYVISVCRGGALALSRGELRVSGRCECRSPRLCARDPCPALHSSEESRVGSPAPNGPREWKE